MMMYNKIEIMGTVGNVRISTFEDRRSANFSVVTNYLYKNRDGNAAVETLWLNVTAWEGKAVSGEVMDNLDRGCDVHVTGRLREREYTGADGSSRTVMEVVANLVELVTGNIQVETVK